MAKIIVIFCLVFFLIALFTEPRKLNPLTLFLGEWAVIVYLANLNLYGLYSTSEATYTVILIGCICFVLGFYLVKFFRNINKNRKLSNSRGSTTEYELNFKLVTFLSVITIIYFSVDFFNSLIYLLQGQSLGYIRQLAQQGALFSNPIMNAIRILITAPFATVLIYVVASNYFSMKRNNFLMFSVAIILIFRLLSDGGRSPLIYLSLSFLISYLYSGVKKNRVLNYKNDSNKLILRLSKYHLFMILFILIIAISLYSITLSRSGAESIRYTYYYFAMQPYMLELWSKKVVINHLIGFGMSSLNGILFPIFYVLSNFIPFMNYPETWRQVYDVLESTGTDWQVITQYGTTANSYISIFWSLYYDGRLVGVVLGMILVGVAMGYSYYKVLDFPNQKNIAIFSALMIGLFYSFQQLITQNIYWTMSFVFLIFVVYKKKERL
ncbi:O-antigen polymerase [Streptococcus alactolyticus]|uniref:O-antigen polymerase n=1 Tax=Streptococcus alactolyticus TaxID=29389 RepID=UPI0037539A71